jgi:hypothetical protein
MPAYESDDNVLGTDKEAYYETVASQEEIYLEEREETLRAVLTETPSAPQQTTICLSESPEEQLEHAAEDLVAGDSDDPPLSEDSIADLLAAAKSPEHK